LRLCRSGDDSMIDLDKLSRVKVAVLGDVILDEYIYGRVSRISPEAPVPVLEVQSRMETIGGAGNVARNISSLDGKVELFSVLGDDASADRFFFHAKENCIKTSGIIRSKTRITSLKQRVVAQNQQIVRIDSEKVESINNELERALSLRVESASEECDVLVISDYDKGVLTDILLDKALSSFRSKDKPIVVDPNVLHFFKYGRATVVTPNHLQVERVSGKRIRDEKELFSTGIEIRKRLGETALLITRGEEGMALFSDSGIVKIATVAREVYDVTGAGDTVVALLAMGLGSGYSLELSARIANAAAGIAVGKHGTAIVLREELEFKLRELSLIE